MVEYFGMGLLIWNCVIFLVYGIDKGLAKIQAYRIPESILLLLAFFLGALGACLGSVLFNHKTAKWKFRLLLPIALLLNVFLIGYSAYYWPE